jgi:hypothetical protein
MREYLKENPELEEIKKIKSIMINSLPQYEIRGVFKIQETTPAGIKCNYVEHKIDSIDLELLYGGIILACAGQDRTTGINRLEVSTRDKTIRVDHNASSRDAKNLEIALLEENLRFKIITN